MAGIDIDAPGTRQLWMGNEAIARGALEAGIGVAAAYPGTPSTEILESLVSVADKMGIYTEWSVNEIVAAEVAAGASYAGIRALSPMKCVGLNVASNFLCNILVAGLDKGGLVFVSCDDPSTHSSSSEMDSRGIAKWWDIPLLEPGTFQECKDMTKYLFDLSEELGSVCMLRSVTRISHARGNIVLGELPQKEFKAHLDDTYDIWNPQMGKFRSAPAALKHGTQHERLEKARAKFESSPFNWYVGPDKAELLIITGGSCWLHSQEAVKALRLEDKVGILKLGTVWPLPEKFVASHLGKSQKILFVEETDPIFEQSVMELVANLPIEPRPVFYGRRSGHISVWGELDPQKTMKAITSIMGLTYQPRDTEYVKKAQEVSKTYAPERSITFCPGCPHRASYWAIKNALRLDGRDGFVVGDIGCYAIAQGLAGWFQMRTKHGMGSGIGIASGLGKLGRFGLDQPIIAVSGDSTFYHAGIERLVNAIHQKSDFITVIFDNNATAMTGFQPHPGSEMGGSGEPAQVVNMEALCRSLGARVEICDPFDIKKTIATLVEMLADTSSGAKVLIMRHECELIRGRKEKKNPYKVHVDPDKCIGETCGCDRLCTRVFRCPGLVWDKEAGKSKIDEVICTGCGLCVDICPHGAIIKEAT